MKRAFLAVIAAGMLLVPHSSRAADAPPAKPLSATAKLGYVQTGGNTDVLTLLAGDQLGWVSGHWTLKQDADAVYGRDHGVENAGRYFLGLRGDYTLSARVSTYGLASWRRNTFGGINRQFDEGVGLVLHAITPKPQTLDLEAGAGLTQREDITYLEDDFGTGRLAGMYQYAFHEKSKFQVSSAWVVNLNDSSDSQLDSSVSLAAPIESWLSLNLGYDSNYRSKPLAGFENTDWTVSAGLQITY
ncbi:MAG: DUF481 domain-containing protein [Candidatus Eiseniibacteriota bacterium]